MVRKIQVSKLHFLIVPVHIILKIFVLLLIMIFLTACPGKKTGDDLPVDDQDGDTYGRYIFDVPIAFTSAGNIDTPRLARAGETSNVHLVFLQHDGTSQRIMYSKYDGTSFSEPTSLSQREGQKRGGGYLESFSQDHLIAYWINIPAIGGQLYYKMSDNNARTFTFEARWNERNEARWPCVLNVDGQTNAYFFVHSGNDWELVINQDFQDRDESLVKIANGTPFHLQGLTGEDELVCLAYFVRSDNSDTGRIAYLRSTDGGKIFDWWYMFDDMLIQNISSFFRIEIAEFDGDEVVYMIFTEETPEHTMVYFSRSEDSEIFSTPIAIFTSENPLTRSPLLLAKDNYVFIATVDTEDEGPGLRYVISEDMGRSFDAAGLATRSVSSPETMAGILYGDGKVMLVWDDLSMESASGEQLYVLNGELMRR